MPAADVFEEILEQIAITWPVPQMVVRIDDRQLGFEDLFAALVQPVRPNRCMAARRYRRLGHLLALFKVGVGLPQLCPGASGNSILLVKTSHAKRYLFAADQLNREFSSAEYLAEFALP